MHSLKWKKFNEFLEVSNTGEVKSHGRIIKGDICKNGYKRIHVSHKGMQHKYLVHRMVAKLFIPNPQNKPCVNHKDGNKLNNNVDNLEWCTYGENLYHAFENGLRDCSGTKNPSSKLTDEDVKEIRALYVKGKHCEYNSYGLAKRYGVSPKCIQNIVKNISYKEVV